MPTISFAKKNRDALDVPMGANLMRALLAAGLPVASSCNGDGVCAKCRVTISSGGPGLTKPTALEIKLTATSGLRADERISCQVRVRSDVEIDASYW